mgnify:CR=1 FL=1
MRESGGRIVTALSGSETVEQAYALGRLLRGGLSGHTALMPEETSPALDAFRLPLSAIRDAELVVVLGDEPVAERAPVVELWLKAARRAGRRGAPHRRCARGCKQLAGRDDELGGRLRESERAILIWSGEDGAGGRTSRPWRGSSASPASPARARSTCRARRTAAVWPTPGPAPTTSEGEAPEQIGLLIVSGDEAAADPNVRVLAERAERVLVTSMFQSLAAGWADLVLPGTSYLERDGTYVNLEGRLQRLRRTVIPPAPDELAWISKLAERFGVEVAALRVGGLHRAVRADLRRPPVRRRRGAGRAAHPQRGARGRPARAAARAQGQGPRA